MYEFANYIPTPVVVNDVVTITDIGRSNFYTGKVIRVEYNYCDEEGTHKVFFKADDPEYNIEFDDVTQSKYMTIVLQVMDN